MVIETQKIEKTEIDRTNWEKNPSFLLNMQCMEPIGPSIDNLFVYMPFIYIIFLLYPPSPFTPSLFLFHYNFILIFCSTFFSGVVNILVKEIIFTQQWKTLDWVIKKILQN